MNHCVDKTWGSHVSVRTKGSGPSDVTIVLKESQFSVADRRPPRFRRWEPAMDLKQAQTIMMKARRFVELVQPHCDVDENFFARGLTSDGKWVAWVMMKPGHEILVDGPAGRPGPKELNEAYLDELLGLRWEPAKPINAIEQMARVAAFTPPDAHSGRMAIIDGRGRSMVQDPPADNNKKISGPAAGGGGETAAASGLGSQ